MVERMDGMPMVAGNNRFYDYLNIITQSKQNWNSHERI